MKQFFMLFALVFAGKVSSQNAFDLTIDQQLNPTRDSLYVDLYIQLQAGQTPWVLAAGNFVFNHNTTALPTANRVNYTLLSANLGGFDNNPASACYNSSTIGGAGFTTLNVNAITASDPSVCGILVTTTKTLVGRVAFKIAACNPPAITWRTATGTINRWDAVATTVNIKAQANFINPTTWPTALTVSPSSVDVCSGSIQTPIQTNSSDINMRYELLKNGISTGVTKIGNGSALNFSVSDLSSISGVVSTDVFTISADYNSTAGNCATTYGSISVNDLNVTPSVSISITSGVNPAPTGSSVTFTATPTNGGTPTYQWKKNGSNISGQTSATYTAIAGTDFVSTDDITCEMTSTAACASPTLVSSNTLTMTVLPAGPGWAVGEGNTGTNDYANAISKDGNGNYYVGGTKGSTGFISKYSASGMLIWTKNYGSSVNGITINDANNAVITGGYLSTTTFGGLTYTSGSTTNSTDAYVAALDVNGDVSNAVKIGGSSIDLGNAIARDDLGNIYVTGEYNLTVDFDPSANIVSRTSAGLRDVFAVKFDQNLGFQWVYTIGGVNQDKALGIAVGDGVYITGQYHGAMSGLTSAGTFDGFVMKLSKSSGSRMWEQSFGSTGAEDKGNAIALDASNNVYIAGAFSGSVLGLTGNGSSVDALIFSVDALGNFRWSKKGGAGGKDIAYGISVNGNEVLTTGYVRSAGSFTGSGYLNGTAGTNDVFVVKYLTDGTFGCYRLMSGAGDQEGRAIWAGAGTFALAGINSGTLGAELDDLTTIPLTTTGLFDVFVMEGQTCTSGSMKMAPTLEETNNTLSVYPNPNNGQFTVKGTGTLQVSIINMNGIVVSEQKSENEMLIDLKNEVSGIYLVKIQTELEEKFFRVQVIK